LQSYCPEAERRGVRGNVVKGRLSLAVDVTDARRAAPAINCFNKLH
jgi:hypothetical protein